MENKVLYIKAEQHKFWIRKPENVFWTFRKKTTGKRNRLIGIQYQLAVIISIQNLRHEQILR